MTLSVALYIDTARVADGHPTDDPTAPYAIDGLTVTWGRPTTVDQPDASSCTFYLRQRIAVPDPDAFTNLLRLGRRVDVLAERGSIYDTVTVFAGFITDVVMGVADDDPLGLLVFTVTADDLLADLNNRAAASTPWPKESVSARFAHIIDAARVGTSYTISSDLAGIQVAKLDADSGSNSMVTEQLSAMATSLDGVLWSAGDSNFDPKLVLESPALRAPLRRLELDTGDMLVKITLVGIAAGALYIDPCVPNLLPIQWRSTMSDLVTGVSVTYYTPDPTDPTGLDLPTTITLVDPGSESPSKPWGARRMVVDSQLTNATDATQTASKLLARLSTPTWRMSNLTIDQAETVTLSDADMMRVLNYQSRHGIPIILQPLPPWAPSDEGIFSGYLEGGDITSTAGVWSVSLWVSAAQGYAGQSGTWNDLPDDAVNWQWQDIDPSITWADLVGVGGPAS